MPKRPGRVLNRLENVILRSFASPEAFKSFSFQSFIANLISLNSVGDVKRLYRMRPESSKEDQLEINALEFLDAIPIESMRRYGY